MLRFAASLEREAKRPPARGADPNVWDRQREGYRRDAELLREAANEL